MLTNATVGNKYNFVYLLHGKSVISCRQKPYLGNATFITKTKIVL